MCLTDIMNKNIKRDKANQRRTRSKWSKSSILYTFKKTEKYVDQHAQRHSRLSRLVFSDLRLSDLTDGRLKCQVFKAKSTRQKAARCALFSLSHPSLQDPNISTAHLGMVIFEIQGKMFSMFMFKPPRSILAWLRLVLLPSTFLFLGVNQFGDFGSLLPALIQIAAPRRLWIWTSSTAPLLSGSPKWRTMSDGLSFPPPYPCSYSSFKLFW